MHKQKKRDDDDDEVEKISDERDEIHTTPLKELFERVTCIYLYFSLCFYVSCTYKIISLYNFAKTIQCA